MERQLRCISNERAARLHINGVRAAMPHIEWHTDGNNMDGISDGILDGISDGILDGILDNIWMGI